MSSKVNKGIWLSVILHCALLWAISGTIDYQVTENPSNKLPINSYIYTPPKVTPIEKPIPKKPELLDAEQEQIGEKKGELVEEVEEKVKQVEPIEDFEINEVQQTKNTKETATEIASETVKQEESVKPKKPIAYSTLEQLKLRNKALDRELFDSVLRESNNPNTGSALHGTPQVVPHSKKQLTESEKETMQTQQLSGDMSIRNTGDGRCSITRDLSTITGLDGEVVTEHFNCGLTKMERAFKEHMKKVKERRGK